MQVFLLEIKWLAAICPVSVTIIDLQSFINHRLNYEGSVLKHNFFLFFFLFFFFFEKIIFNKRNSFFLCT